MRSRVWSYRRYRRKSRGYSRNDKTRYNRLDQGHRKLVANNARQFAQSRAKNISAADLSMTAISSHTLKRFHAPTFPRVFHTAPPPPHRDRKQRFSGIHSRSRVLPIHIRAPRRRRGLPAGQSRQFQLFRRDFALLNALRTCRSACTQWPTR